MLVLAIVDSSYNAHHSGSLKTETWFHLLFTAFLTFILAVLGRLPSHAQVSTATSQRQPRSNQHLCQLSRLPFTPRTITLTIYLPLYRLTLFDSGPWHLFLIMNACNRAPVEINRSPQTHIHSQRSASFGPSHCLQCSIHCLLQLPTPSTASRGFFM
ncbi:hypothetical protein BDR06DRAFT_963103, partial [Suillus hirtellus]